MRSENASTLVTQVTHLTKSAMLSGSHPKTQPIENWRFYPEKLSEALLPFGG